ncbi:capsid protein [Circoviridae sp.]|nr:capsid protein [Circoviridae sp.]UOF82718.1 capsid protein [Circoviridae sp.]
MVKYTRKRFRKRAKAPWYRRKYSPMQMAMKALAATRYLKGLVNSERMYFDRSVSLGAIKSQNFSCVQISQGDQVGQRTGNSVLLRSIYWRGFLQINPSVTVNTRISLVLVKDTLQVSDTTPQVLDIFTSNDPEATLRVGQTDNNAGRFKIIWRKNYNLVPNQKPTITIDKFWRIYDHIKFNGPAGTDIQRNGYYMCILSSEATNFPTVTIQSRIGYHDN